MFWIKGRISFHLVLSLPPPDSQQQLVNPDCKGAQDLLEQQVNSLIPFFSRPLLAHSEVITCARCRELLLHLPFFHPELVKNLFRECLGDALPNHPACPLVDLCVEYLLAGGEGGPCRTLQKRRFQLLP
jgi:hypothetical protein